MAMCNRRRVAAALMAGALTVAACGDDGVAVEDVVDGSGSEVSAAGESTPEASSDTSAESSGGPIVVDLTDSIYDLALLGVAPVGNIYGTDLIAPQLAQLDGVDPGVAAAIVETPDLGTAGGFEINLEAIAARAPDLIIASETFLGFYRLSMDDLEAIAPVEVIDESLDWQDRTRQVAMLVGVGDEADDRIAAVEAELAEIRRRVEAEGLEGTTVSLLRPFGATMTFFQARSLAGQMLADVGLTQPEAQLVDVETGFPAYASQVQFSAELLADHDADAVVVLAEDVSVDPVAAFPSGYLAAETPTPVPDGAVLLVPIFLWAVNSLAGADQIADDLDTLVDLLAS